jgi:hypothetical protein
VLILRFTCISHTKRGREWFDIWHFAQPFDLSSVEMEQEFPDHQARTFTNGERGEPLLKQRIQATNTRFPCFALIFPRSP